MVGQDAKYNQLMQALGDHEFIEAAVVVDGDGHVHHQIGAAKSLLATPDGPERPAGTSGRDNVYLVGAGDQFLVVVFGEHLEFDRVKHNVDQLLSDLEL